MKKNKLIILVFLQIFAITTIFLIGYSSTLNYPPPLVNNHESSTISTNSIGVIMWDNNGTLISKASNDQEIPEICSDGSGGAIITWFDKRNGVNYDVYAQWIKIEIEIEPPLNGGENGDDEGDNGEKDKAFPIELIIIISSIIGGIAIASIVTVFILKKRRKIEQ